jgi:hypothetical protein
VESIAVAATLLDLLAKARRMGDAYRRASRTNDAKAEAAYEELLEEMVLELQAYHQARGGKARVDPEDVASAAEELRRAASRAGSDKKRWLLSQAFVHRFDPALMESGMNNILWRIAEAIEYPEAELLRRLGVSPLRTASC